NYAKLVGTGDLNVSGLLDWRNGDLIGSGTVTANGPILLAGPVWSVGPWSATARPIGMGGWWTLPRAPPGSTTEPCASAPAARCCGTSTAGGMNGSTTTARSSRTGPARSSSACPATTSAQSQSTPAACPGGRGPTPAPLPLCLAPLLSSPA